MLKEASVNGVIALIIALPVAMPSMKAQELTLSAEDMQYDANGASIALDGDGSDWADAEFKSQIPFEKGGELVLFEEYGGGTWSGPADHSSAVAFAWDASNLYIGVVVTDDTHQNGGSGWNGDSIQMVFANAAQDTVTHLYNYGLSDGGDVVIHSEKGPGGSEASITHDDDTTTTLYEFGFPAASLCLDAYESGMQIGVGVCVNDGDTEGGQKGWGGWGPYAAVYGKTASATGLVSLVGEAGGLASVASSTESVSVPTIVVFGDLSGDASYEFYFKAIKAGASTAIAGNNAFGLKLDQWNEQGLFGTTVFGVADNLFTSVEGKSAASVFDRDVHVVVVNDTATGETRLYVDGDHVGVLDGNFELAGEANVMGLRINANTDPMGEGSVMHKWATYNVALTDAQIAKLAAAAGGGGAPSISLVHNADGTLTVTFDGKLQAAPTVNGPWQSLEEESPYTLTPDQAQTFGRSIAASLLMGNAIAEEAKPGTILLAESFNDAELQKRDWYDGSRFKIVSDGAFAGNGCIEYRWKEKATNPHTSAGARHSIKATDQLYIRFYIKLSENWDWSGRSYHPHLAHFLSTENGKWHGPARSHLTLYIEPVNGKLRLGATDMENADMPHGLTQGPLKGGYNGKLYDSKDVIFKDDKWHCIEAHFKLNSLDIANDKTNADGVIRGWFDGNLVIDHTNIVLRTTDFPSMKWNQFLLTPYFGPGLLPHSQALWIDELVVSTERMRPLSDTSTNKR